MKQKEVVMDSVQLASNEITWVVFTCEKCGTNQIKRYIDNIKHILTLPPICCRMCYGNCQPSYIDIKTNRKEVFHNE